MAHVGRTAGLQTIFSFFVGLMVTAFVGVGVYTFHPPERELDRQIQSLNRQEQATMKKALVGAHGVYHLYRGRRDAQGASVGRQALEGWSVIGLDGARYQAWNTSCTLLARRRSPAGGSIASRGTALVVDERSPR